MSPRDHPRLRGEHDACEWLFEPASGSSPPTRGARTRVTRCHEISRIIPAYAGSTSRVPPRATLNRDHPRLRGEHSEDRQLDGSVLGSSPPTRGARLGDRRRAQLGGIIPAYAGSTSWSPPAGERSRDHPRLRGEHSVDLPADIGDGGSSPPTRGAPHRLRARPRTRGIIPAYAGSTGRLSRRPGCGPDHPRLRGEHDIAVAKSPVNAGSSPPTRGARGHDPVHALAGRIIPAYAGSTRRRGSAWSAVRDHPRLRGEHRKPSTATA